MGKRYDELEARYAGEYPRMPVEWFVGPVQQVLGAACAEVADDLDSHTAYVEAKLVLFRTREHVRGVLEDVMRGYSARWADRTRPPRHGICYELNDPCAVHMLTEVAARWPHARRSCNGLLAAYYCTVDEFSHYWEGENFFVRTLLLREFLKVLDMAIKEVQK